MFIYIFVGWRVLGLLGVHPRLIVGRFNRNAPATYGISSFFQFVGPFPSANSGSIYMWVSINGVTVPQARWMITISLFRGKSNRKWMMTRGTPMSGNLHIPLYNFWLVVSTPLKKYEFVSWDYEIPNIWKKKIHVPNHQPVYHVIIWPVYMGSCFSRRSAVVWPSMSSTS